jgi:hypothetical protein
MTMKTNEQLEQATCNVARRYINTIYIAYKQQTKKVTSDGAKFWDHDQQI